MNTKTLARPLIEGLAWSGDNLIAIDPDVVDKRIRRKALSASTGKSMKGCLAKFAGDKLLPRPDDAFSDSELGTATHAIIEDLYNMPNADRTLDAFHALKDSHADIKWSVENLAIYNQKHELVLLEDEWYTNKFHWKGEIVRLGAGVFEIENPAEQTTFKTEMPFEGVTIAGGVPAMGFIDRIDVIVVREKDRLKAIDLKTGKMKSAFDLRRYGDDHGDQIRIYADAIEQVTGAPPAVGSIHYTQFGASREIPLTELAMELTRKDFRAAWDIHNEVTDSGVFPTKVGPLCGWCPLVNACPAAAKAGKTASDRVKTVPASAVELGIPTVRKDVVPMGSKLPVTAPLVHTQSAAVATKSIAVASSAYVEEIPFSDVAPADLSEPTAAAEAVMTLDVLGSSAVVTSLTKALDTAHVLRDNERIDGIGNPTVNTTPLVSEGKPWEATINGQLNAASYAAMAVVSIPQLAGELLIEAGRPLNGTTIVRMTNLLAEIIVTVQKTFRAGQFDWDSGINTRIRGALRTTIETLPLPWDATDESAWEAWQDAATKRTTVFIKKALDLFALGENIPHDSFAALLPTQVTDIRSKPKPGAQKVA